MGGFICDHAKFFGGPKDGEMGPPVMTMQDHFVTSDRSGMTWLYMPWVSENGTIAWRIRGQINLKPEDPPPSFPF